jgi:aryl-alcohol dehydrogenase-like predicted oxidoreductase
MVEHRRFGQTGLKVSVLGLGCGGFGGVGSAPELFGRGEDKQTAFARRVVHALWISDRQHLHRFSGVQNEYNLLRRQIEGEVLPMAAELGLAVTPYGPLAGGLLTGKYRLGSDPPPGSRMTLRPEPYRALWNPATFRAIDALVAEAREWGVTPAALALAWVTSHPQVSAALIGPRSPDQFAPAIESLSLHLSPADRDRIASRMAPP